MNTSTMCKLCGIWGMTPMDMFVLGVILGRGAGAKDAQITEAIASAVERMKNALPEGGREVVESAEEEARAHLIQSVPPELRQTLEEGLRAGPTPTMTDRLYIGLDLCDEHRAEFAASSEKLMHVLAASVITQ